MVICCTSDLLKLNYYFVDVCFLRVYNSFHLSTHSYILRVTSVTCFPPTFPQLSSYVAYEKCHPGCCCTICLGAVISTLNSHLFVLPWHMIHSYLIIFSLLVAMTHFPKYPLLRGAIHFVSHVCITNPVR